MSDEEGPISESFEEEDPSEEIQESEVSRPADLVIALVEEVGADPESVREA